jgi:glutathione synthase/RimK-type ligase-like ATP-grasp enzyme
VVVLGNPSNRRVRFFQEALGTLGWPQAQVVSWQRALEAPETLLSEVGPRTLLRIDSPGESFEVERLLIARGAEVPDRVGPSRISTEEALDLEDDFGRVRHIRQWYLGLKASLESFAPRLDCALMNHPADIVAAFDKPMSQALIASAGVRTPPTLGTIHGYDHLREAMNSAGLRSVFVKLSHGSAASGVVAFSTRRRALATTSLELEGSGSSARFYNSLNLHRYTSQASIREVIDFVCAEGAQVEAWIPKARQGGCAVDLRVVVIGGVARHVVLRKGRGPMTNLHLGGGRGDLDAFKAKVCPEAWAEMMAQCESAAAVFPDSLYFGVDLLVSQDHTSGWILEINAFGDLVPGIVSRGEDTFTAELRALTAPEAI